MASAILGPTAPPGGDPPSVVGAAVVVAQPAVSNVAIPAPRMRPRNQPIRLIRGDPLVISRIVLAAGHRVNRPICHGEVARDEAAELQELSQVRKSQNGPPLAPGSRYFSRPSTWRWRAARPPCWARPLARAWSAVFPAVMTGWRGGRRSRRTHRPWHRRGWPRTSRGARRAWHRRCRVAPARSTGPTPPPRRA